jgi:hypothetical protein
MKKPKWFRVEQFGCIVERGNVRLVVSVVENDGRWAVIAVESGAPAKRTAKQTIEAVFADHGHRVIGVERTLRKALAAGTAYVTTWLTARVDPVVACACDEITDAKPTGVARSRAGRSVRSRGTTSRSSRRLAHRS